MKKASISQKRIEQIARNINAMDIKYEYCDDSKRYKFWRNLKKKLDNILSNLSDFEKSLVASLCVESQKKYFNLI